MLCGHLLGKGWPLGSRLWCLLWVCHFPIGILGQVWYLIVSIPDLCTITYFDTIGLDARIYPFGALSWFLVIILSSEQIVKALIRLRGCVVVGHPEPEKKLLLAFLSTFWHPCSKYIWMCFKKDRGGCQVWKCPKVPELDQRSTKCKFLHIRQILAFLSINYPKLRFKVMQNLFWILQPCYINKKHHQGMMCVWIKGHSSAKWVKIVAIFYLYRGKNQILSFLLPKWKIFFITILLGVCLSCLKSNDLLSFLRSNIHNRQVKNVTVSNQL